MHPLFAPALLIAIFALGSATIAFLLLGPGLGPWADTLLRACFGWNAETRRYRLDSLVLALLQPPLFAAVVFAFYADDVRAFLASRRGMFAGILAPALFLALAVSLLATSEISASGAAPGPAALPSPLRQGAPAPVFSLVDHRGELVSLERLKGRAVAMTFVYANCHGSCPLLISRLKSLEARVVGASVIFVAVSLDPERDTPAALREAAERWELGERWHLVTGTPDAVRRVAAAYGIQWAPLPDGEIAHENVVLFIDRQGRLAFTYRGLAHPEERQSADLARLASERG
jgi:protein SCO1/2